MNTGTNIFIINLEKQKERWNELQNYLNNYPINYQRFEAVYGKDIPQKEIEQKTTWLARNLLINYGTIGCFLSHTNLWKKLVEDRENNFYLIFEDDFNIIDFESINKLYNLYNNQEINYDYLSLYTNGKESFLDKDVNCIEDITISQKFFPTSTVGYFITKNGAKKLLKKINNKVKYHIDWYLIYLSKFRENFKVYNTKKNLIGLNQIGLHTSSINEIQNKTLLYYLLPYENYFFFQYGLTFKLKKTISIEFMLSFALLILLLYSFIKTKNKILIPFIILLCVNVYLSY
jgi:GR25 family glycosyltransferase involved in LPS biosynthesis